MKIFGFRSILAVTTLAFSALAGATPSFASSTYSFTDLGTFGGVSSTGSLINNSGQVAGRVNFANGTSSSFLYSGNGQTSFFTGTLVAMNNSGQVTGLNGAMHPYIYSGGVSTDIYNYYPVASGTNMVGGINNSGAVSGAYRPGGIWHGFIYDGTSFTDLMNSAPSGVRQLSTAKINDSGQAAGSLQNNSGWRGYLYSNGTVTVLDTLGGLESRAVGINKAGQVAGYSTISNEAGGYQHAFLYTNGQMQDLSPGSPYRWEPKALNDKGQVIGTYGGSINGVSFGHAFLYSNGTMTDLGTLAGNNSMATGINNLGQVIGYSNFTDQSSGSYHPFIFPDGKTLIDATTLLPEGWSFSTSTSDSLTGINDRGQIIGNASYNGQTHAILLTPNAAPVPLPPAFFMFGSGLAGIGFLRRKLFRR